jgi:hypothetical protein
LTSEVDWDLRCCDHRRRASAGFSRQLNFYSFRKALEEGAGDEEGGGGVGHRGKIEYQ